MMNERIQIDIAKKRLSFAVLNVKKKHFSRYSMPFWHFSYLQFVPDFSRSDGVLGSFFTVLTKIWPKTCIEASKARIYIFYLFDLG